MVLTGDPKKEHPQHCNILFSFCNPQQNLVFRHYYCFGAPSITIDSFAVGGWIGRFVDIAALMVPDPVASVSECVGGHPVDVRCLYYHVVIAHN